MNTKKELIRRGSFQKFSSINPLNGKRGAIDWTVGKLMSLVLLVILLVMIIYGVSVGGLNPLIKRMGDSLDQAGALVNKVLTGIGIKDKDPLQGCYSEIVERLSDGNSFLDSMGVTGEERSAVILKVCSDNVCNLSGGGIGEYSYKNFELYNLNDGIETKQIILHGDLDDLMEAHILFNSVTSILESKGVSREFYTKLYTRSFEMVSDGSGFNEVIHAKWSDGVWTIWRGDEIIRPGTFEEEISPATIIYEGEDDEVAINSFYEVVKGGFLGFGADNILYEGVGPNYLAAKENPKYVVNEPIGSLVGDLGTSYDKLDSIEEVDKLKEKFILIKKIIQEDSELNSEELGKLREAINGEDIEVGGENFFINVEKEGYYPLIILSSNSKVYQIKFEPRAINSRSYIASLDKVAGEIEGFNVKYPLIIVKKFDSGVLEFREEDYKLPKEIFDKAYEGTITYRFLQAKCR